MTTCSCVPGVYAQSQSSSTDPLGLSLGPIVTSVTNPYSKQPLGPVGALTTSNFVQWIPWILVPGSTLQKNMPPGVSPGPLNTYSGLLVVNAPTFQDPNFQGADAMFVLTNDETAGPHFTARFGIAGSYDVSMPAGNDLLVTATFDPATQRMTFSDGSVMYPGFTNCRTTGCVATLTNQCVANLVGQTSISAASAGSVTVPGESGVTPPTSSGPNLTADNFFLYPHWVHPGPGGTMQIRPGPGSGQYQFSNTNFDDPKNIYTATLQAPASNPSITSGGYSITPKRFGVDTHVFDVKDQVIRGLGATIVGAPMLTGCSLPGSITPTGTPVSTLAPTAAPVSTVAPTPRPSSKKPFPLWAILLIVLLGLGALAAVLALLFRRRKSSKASTEQQSSAASAASTSPESASSTSS